MVRFGIRSKSQKRYTFIRRFLSSGIANRRLQARLSPCPSIRNEVSAVLVPCSLSTWNDQTAIAVRKLSHFIGKKGRIAQILLQVSLLQYEVRLAYVRKRL